MGVHRGEADPNRPRTGLSGIFWRCVQRGEIPRVFGAEPLGRTAAPTHCRYGASNAWAEYAAIFARTRAAHAEHEAAEATLKALVPDDAREAFGYGVRAKRSRAGAISFELMCQRRNREISGRIGSLSLQAGRDDISASPGAPAVPLASERAIA